MGATIANRTIQFGVRTKRETNIDISSVTTSASTNLSVITSSLERVFSALWISACEFTGFPH